MNYLLELLITLYWLYRVPVWGADELRLQPISKWLKLQRKFAVSYIFLVEVNRIGFKWPLYIRRLVDIFFSERLPFGGCNSILFCQISYFSCQPQEHGWSESLRVQFSKEQLRRIKSGRSLGKWTSSLCMRYNIQHSWYGFAIRTTYSVYPVYSWTFSQ